MEAPRPDLRDKLSAAALELAAATARCARLERDRDALARETQLWRQAYDRLYRSRPVQAGQRVRALAGRLRLGSGPRSGIDTTVQARRIQAQAGQLTGAGRPGVDSWAQPREVWRGRDRVRIGVASIPQRAAGLARVVELLYDQADEICVYLNGYPEVPGFLVGDEKLRPFTGEDLADRGKFRFLDDFSGYYLTVDDDIEYPSFYVEHCLDGIERYGRQAAVGWHGSLLDPGITDYYDHSRRRVLDFRRDLDTDTFVQVLGTGCAAFHTDTLALSLADFPAPNMADVFFALQAHRQQVPLVTLAHRAGWATAIPFPREATIWGASTDRTTSTFDTREETRRRLPELAAAAVRSVDPLVVRASIRLGVVGAGGAGEQAEQCTALELALRDALAPLGVDVRAVAEDGESQGSSAAGCVVHVLGPGVEASGLPGVVLQSTRRDDGFLLTRPDAPAAGCAVPDRSPARRGRLPRFEETAGVVLAGSGHLVDGRLLAEPLQEWVAGIAAALPGVPVMFDDGDGQDLSALVAIGLQRRGEAAPRLVVSPFAQEPAGLAGHVAELGAPVVRRGPGGHDAGGAGGLTVDGPADLAHLLPALYADPTVWRWARDAGGGEQSRPRRLARAADLYLWLRRVCADADG